MRLKIALKTTNKNVSRVESCISTWLGGLDHVCVTDRASGLFDEVSCGAGEDYESAEEKTCNFFMMVRDGFLSDYDWVMLIDDDAVLNHGMISDMIPSLDQGMVHGYDMVRAWPKDLSLSYPSGGGGYLVSPELVRSLPPMEILGIGLEDVRVGVWMRENGVRLGSSLPLWPWFPKMSVKYWEFVRAEEEGKESVESLISRLTPEDMGFLKSKVTAHYVRGRSTMKGLFEVMVGREG